MGRIEIPRDLHTRSKREIYDILSRVRTKNLIDACEDEIIRPIIVSFLNRIELHVTDKKPEACYIHSIDKQIPKISLSKHSCAYCIRDYKYIGKCEKYGINYCVSISEKDESFKLSEHNHCTMICAPAYFITEPPNNLVYLEIHYQRYDNLNYVTLIPKSSNVEFLVLNTVCDYDIICALHERRNITKIAIFYPVIYCINLITCDHLTELHISDKHKRSNGVVFVPMSLTRLSVESMHIKNIHECAHLTHLTMIDVSTDMALTSFKLKSLTHYKLVKSYLYKTQGSNNVIEPWRRVIDVKPDRYTTIESKNLVSFYYKWECNIIVVGNNMRTAYIEGPSHVYLNSTVKYAKIKSVANLYINSPYAVYLDLSRVVGGDIYTPMLNRLRLDNSRIRLYSPNLEYITLNSHRKEGLPPTIKHIKFVHERIQELDLSRCHSLESITFKNSTCEKLFVYKDIHVKIIDPPDRDCTTRVMVIHPNIWYIARNLLEHTCPEDVNN